MVIKSFVREKFEGKKQYNLQMQLMESQLYTRRTSFIFDGLKTFIEQFGVVLIILLTVYLVLDQQMTIGAIMLHIMLFNNVSAPIRQLHRIYDDMNDAFIYAEGYFEILNDDDETEPNGTINNFPIKGSFEIKNVDFTYPNGMKALKNVSLKIENGKTTALVGLSGAGKSTVINLLCKFYEPDSGEILLDGNNLNDFDNDYLRDDLGLVLQKTTFSKEVLKIISDTGIWKPLLTKLKKQRQKLIFTSRFWICQMVIITMQRNFPVVSNSELRLQDYS